MAVIVETAWVARRVAGMVSNRISATVYLDGGSAWNQGQREALEDELILEVMVLPEPQFTVTYGAALILWV